jgi:hypothetical protein
MHGSKLGGGDCPSESWTRDPLRNFEPGDSGAARRGVESPSRGPRLVQRIVGTPSAKGKTATRSGCDTMATAVSGGTMSAALEEFLGRVQSKP